MCRSRRSTGWNQSLNFNLLAHVFELLWRPIDSVVVLLLELLLLVLLLLPPLLGSSSQHPFSKYGVKLCSINS